MTDYRAVAMAWVAEADHRPMVEAAARHLHANESIHLHDLSGGSEPCSYCWLRAAKAIQAIERSGQHIVKALTPEQFAEIEAADLHSLQADAQHNPDVWTLNEWRKQLLAEVKRLTALLENAEQQLRYLAEAAREADNELADRPVPDEVTYLITACTRGGEVQC
jgi:hypothetical protein